MPFPAPTQLERWAVYRVKSFYKDVDGKCYAVGYVERNDAGATFGPVKQFDARVSEIRTALGTRVRLVGPAGTSRDAEDEWKAFCARHRVSAQEDLSSRYQPRPKRGRPPSTGLSTARG
jgi:hypothetical protein